MKVQRTDVDWPEVLQKVLLYVAVVTLQLPVNGIEAGLLCWSSEQPRMTQRVEQEVPEVNDQCIDQYQVASANVLTVSDVSD